MPALADRVKDTTTTTSTGSITLVGSAPTGFRTFASALGSSSKKVRYCIQNSTGSEWELGVGTFDGTTTLTRDSVEYSSNTNSLVNFSAGTKDVFIPNVADDLRAGSVGRTLGINRNLFY